jgi:hypothetical protein
MVEFILSSVREMPPICRVIHRLLFVRTAGFYVDQSSARFVIANLFFLRYLIPPIAEQTTIAYSKDPKMRRVAALLSGALLSLCNGLGWPEDKEPYMLKFGDRMERFYGRVQEFTFQTIDCHDMGPYDMGILNPEGNAVELIGEAAKRVILMNLKEPNRIIRSHMYSVSVMHMIEEFVYTFNNDGAAKT